MFQASWIFVNWFKRAKAISFLPFSQRFTQQAASIDFVPCCQIAPFVSLFWFNWQGQCSSKPANFVLSATKKLLASQLSKVFLLVSSQQRWSTDDAVHSTLSIRQMMFVVVVTVTSTLTNINAEQTGNFVFIFMWYSWMSEREWIVPLNHVSFETYTEVKLNLELIKKK